MALRSIIALLFSWCVCGPSAFADSDAAASAEDEAAMRKTTES